jgi:hypothetical protein
MSWQTACHNAVEDRMTNIAKSEELVWAGKEHVYRAKQKSINRRMRKSFVFMLFLLVLAVTMATVLANVLK